MIGSDVVVAALNHPMPVICCVTLRGRSLFIVLIFSSVAKVIIFSDFFQYICVSRLVIWFSVILIRL